MPFYYMGLIIKLFFIVDPVIDEADGGIDYDGDGDIDNYYTNLHRNSFDPTLHSSISISSPKGIIHFVRGFIEGTHLVSNETNMHTCNNYLELQYAHQITNIIRISKEHIPWGERMFKTMYEVYSMLFYLHPFVNACETMSVDMFYNMTAQFDEMDDLWRAVSNTFHSTPFIYQIILRAITFFKKILTFYGSPFQIGYEFGTIIFYLLVDDSRERIVDPLDHMVIEM